MINNFCKNKFLNINLTYQYFVYFFRFCKVIYKINPEYIKIKAQSSLIPSWSWFNSFESITCSGFSIIWWFHSFEFEASSKFIFKFYSNSSIWPFSLRETSYPGFITEHDSISDPFTSCYCISFFYLFLYEALLSIFWRFWIFFGVLFEDESPFCIDFILYWSLRSAWASFCTFLFFIIF